MLKFNNNHIFTGYIKQLLASFNLPSYRVYGDEAKTIHARNQKIIRWLDTYQLDPVLEEMADIENTLERFPGSMTDADVPTDELKTRLAELKSKIETPSQEDLVNAYNRLLNGEEPGIIQASIKNVSDGKYKPIFSEDTIKKFKDLLQHDQLISTIYRDTPKTYANYGYVDYPEKMRYTPYIKDGKIQEYVKLASTGEYKWIVSHAELDQTHLDVHDVRDHFGANSEKYYIYNRYEPNFSTTLPVCNNEYDTQTHEYLGDYLRFMRDYSGVNLMPLYNCFSDNLCPNIDLEFAVNSAYKAKFKTKDTTHKIYMVPVKMFRKYTIAIESPMDIEVCCGVFGKYYDDSKMFENLPKATYKCYNAMSFANPQLYTALFDATNWLDIDSRANLAIMEKNLKLFIRVPSTLASSIVVLEGDYRDYSDMRLSTSYFATDAANSYNFTNATSSVKYNVACVNFEHINTIVNEHLALPTPLQLLRINTGTSYPFADRLIEYLTGNAITTLDEIGDNVERAKTIAAANNSKEVVDLAIDGLWDDRLKYIFYTYMNNDKYSIEKKHDCLGYVDKDVEANYSYRDKTDTSTIASINIYGTQWED